MGCISKYYWVLRRANKEHKCSRCGVVIKPGELYVYHFGVGMGTNCRIIRRWWCLSCARYYVEEMLNNNVRKLVGFYEYPAKGRMWQLPKSWREEIIRLIPNIERSNG